MPATTPVSGLHHVTAIAGDALKNLRFYTGVLGLRLVKKTVNFDDPSTYHFYYADPSGTPGTILTFFPWGSAVRIGRRGSGMVTETGYAVPEGSLEFWQKRLEAHNVIYNKPARKFGQRYLTFLDPDGLKIELTESPADSREGSPTPEITKDHVLKGLSYATLTLREAGATASVLTALLGYRKLYTEGNRHRYISPNTETEEYIDLVELPTEESGIIAGGCIHHIAFRVKDEAAQEKLTGRIAEAGLFPSQVMDRKYFRSVYFREPGGVLFEIATDKPGFAVDERPDQLGLQLQLPELYEPDRAKIEKDLPRLE